MDKVDRNEHKTPMKRRGTQAFHAGDAGSNPAGDAKDPGELHGSPGSGDGERNGYVPRSQQGVSASQCEREAPNSPETPVITEAPGTAEHREGPAWPAANLRLNLRRRPATCGGRGYRLHAPSDPWNWDVDLVRTDCRGCPDCAEEE